MSAAAPRPGVATLARFLEIQNLGLNLPFAIAFLFLASNGVPALVPFLLIVVAFVAARNAGHSFNRWADREQDARNPRTTSRALVTGRLSPRFALAFALANAAVLVVAAYFLSPLAFLLAPVAIALLFGYTYTKRYTTATTAFLGVVEAITPAAIYIAIVGTLPAAVLLAVGGMLCWGTAFETVHSLGDLESDRALGLRSIPVRFGVPASVRLVPILHAVALALLAAFGVALHLGLAYYAALAAMAAIAAYSDLQLARRPGVTRPIFERHFVLSALFLAGVLVALFVP